MRRFRLYRMVRAGWVILTVALRYWWLGKRDASADRWQRAHAKTGRAIYRLATRLGGAFVKVGQVIGARADVLPAALVDPLRALHDRVPARPFSALRAHVERELGRPIEAVFASVDDTPIAAASLAQVHRARLVTGDDVVLKVQYPEARRLFPVDLRSLRRAVRVARRLGGGLDLRPLADELAELVSLELDFSREARATERIRANLTTSGITDVVVPRVHAELSTDRLLVLEYLPGTPLSEAHRLAARGRRRVAERLATLYATMIFDHGFFHGDPHPGNILVLADDRLGLLDFGLAKELPPDFARSVAALMTAAMASDAVAAVAAARAIGFVVADGRGPELITLIRAVLGDYNNTARTMKQLGNNAILVPSHFTLVARVMVLLNGVSHTLVPGERVIATAMLSALVGATRQYA